jgi:hypothetical protein
MVFELILIATAFVWSRIPAIVSGRFQFVSRDTRRNRSTGTGVLLLAPRIEPSAMAPAASSL